MALRRPNSIITPVLTGHSLNIGLLSFHLWLPTMAGALKWNDLRGIYQGTLASFGANTGWRNKSLWGLPAVTFDASANQQINTSLLPPTGSNPRSFFCVFSDTVASGSQGGMTMLDYGTNAASQLFTFRFDSNAGGPLLTIGLSSSNKKCLFTSCNDGAPHSAGVSYASGAQIQDAALYGDGLVLATTSTTLGTTVANTGSTSNLCIGGCAALSDVVFNGNIGCVISWNRALSASEMKAVHNEAVNGFPRMLFRAGRRFGRSVASGGAGILHGGILHSRIIGKGIVA